MRTRHSLNIIFTFEMPIDLRFNFKRNPYSATQENISPAQNNMFAKLQTYIKDHPSEFISFDPITGIRYTLMENPKDLRVLCGVKNPVEKTYMDDFKYISGNIKKFIGAMQIPLIDELNNWIGDAYNDPSINIVDTQEDDEVVLEKPLTIVNPDSIHTVEDTPEPMLPVCFTDSVSLPQTTLNSINIGVNYDMTTEKRLDYNEVCTLCINIARQLSTSRATKDPAIIAIENKRKRELINEIARYRKNKVIAAVCSDADITRMNIEQLETNLAQCKEKHNNLKLKEISRNSLSILGDAYDAIFPLGIPIGKDRHLCFNGVGDEIIKELHNPTTAVGLSYDNFISKHNIHINDELSIIAAIGTILLKNIHVTRKKSDNDDNEENDEVLMKEHERNYYDDYDSDYDE